MNVLGVHDGHNASAVVLKNGRIVAGGKEERPRGLKNAMGMPRAAIADVLSQAGLKPCDIDLVALAGLQNSKYIEIDPSAKPSDQVLRQHLAAYEGNSINVKGFVRRFVPDSVYESLRGNGMRQRRLEVVASLGFSSERIRLVEHHTAHAASAYYGWG